MTSVSTSFPAHVVGFCFILVYIMHILGPWLKFPHNLAPESAAANLNCSSKQLLMLYIISLLFSSHIYLKTNCSPILMQFGNLHHSFFCTKHRNNGYIPHIRIYRKLLSKWLSMLSSWFRFLHFLFII